MYCQKYSNQKEAERNGFIKYISRVTGPDPLNLTSQYLNALQGNKYQKLN